MEAAAWPGVAVTLAPDPGDEFKQDFGGRG